MQENHLVGGQNTPYGDPPLSLLKDAAVFSYTGNGNCESIEYEKGTSLSLKRFHWIASEANQNQSNLRHEFVAMLEDVQEIFCSIFLENMTFI